MFSRMTEEIERFEDLNHAQEGDGPLPPDELVFAINKIIRYALDIYVR